MIRAWHWLTKPWWMSAIAPLLLGIGSPAIAQTTEDCQPPRAGEYLLLVEEGSETTQSQLQEVLPPTTDIVLCNYFDNIVARVGGFTDLETANSWAQYLMDIGGLQVFVARSPDDPSDDPVANDSPNEDPEAVADNRDAEAEVAAEPDEDLGTEAVDRNEPPEPAQPVVDRSAVPDGSPVAIAPDVLEDGYAVLVEFFDQPAIASNLQQFLGRSVGIVTYQQRPYLLAVYTSDPFVASTTLQNLSDQDFATIMVDSRRVVRLAPEIVLPNPQ